MAGIHSSDDEVISQINVTPLVDVMLVLLVIFLITAPVLYQSAIKVDLPKAQSSGEQTSKNAIEFTISKSGDLYWGKDKVDWQTIEQKIESIPKSEDQPVFISADQGTPHGTVIRLMDVLRKHNLNRFALTVESGATP